MTQPHVGRACNSRFPRADRTRGDGRGAEGKAKTREGCVMEMTEADFIAEVERESKAMMHIRVLPFRYNPHRKPKKKKWKRKGGSKR